MVQFSFSLIGSARCLSVDVDTRSLSDLAEQLAVTRYLEGDMVTSTGELVRVLVPVSRIQLVAEETQ